LGDYFACSLSPSTVHDLEARDAYQGFIHFYNRHRSHGALGWTTLTDALTRLTEDNLPGRQN